MRDDLGLLRQLHGLNLVGQARRLIIEWAAQL
jgi:hypothetical protein